MVKTVKATEVVRHFSDLLNSVKFRGNHYIVLRGGKPIAFIGPVKIAKKEHTLSELKSLLKRIPRLKEEAASFEKDLKEIVKKQPLLPGETGWE